jgi:hypothetical protein
MELQTLVLPSYLKNRSSEPAGAKMTGNKQNHENFVLGKKAGRPNPFTESATDIV